LRTIFVIDAAMGDVVRTSREPMLGAIRLAWWRERLEQLGDDVPAEPRLQAVVSELGPIGVSGRDLAALEGGWARLFEPFPWNAQVAEAIWFRGRHLFALGGRVLGSSTEDIAAAGGHWALVDAARHCSDEPSRTMLLQQARTLGRGIGGLRFPVQLRPLSMLAMLALRDAAGEGFFEPQGSPRRMAAMFGHRLSGRLPPSG
jgi:phytoene synthase